jgi:hypothetical protein
MCGRFAPRRAVLGLIGPVDAVLAADTPVPGSGMKFQPNDETPVEEFTRTTKHSSLNRTDVLCHRT